MYKEFKGNKYSFIIRLTEEGLSYCFEILCRHNQSGHKTRITNLNFILSAIVSHVIDPVRVVDSWFYVSKKEGEKLFIISLKFFDIRSWIESLEKALDEDRTEGEWDADFDFQ